ncbi:unnamed protein product [Cladocopium goreaui]|uniref:WH2 domain-containing protein n=1 Tax=Cladocopium goreaui TaxID=2562237 RepID=A0A9P1BPF8_9DINO|nr:unnamed protein product [Cladocopium goreaui]
MMLIRSALLLAMAMAGRLNQNVFEEGKIPCGCNNKVGLLAPKEKLQGIDIAPDAACAKPGVHASKTPGRFCSCDQGKAKNWNVAATAAQKRLDDALQPKIEALKSLMEKLQEKMGVEIDSSSIGKVKPKVTSFPRVFSNVFHIRCEFDGLGHGVINAQAPDRACEDEFATETTAEVTEPEEEPQEPLTTVEPLSTVEPEPETEGEEEEVTGSGASEASEVDAVPSPPAPPVSDSRSALLRQIQEGTKLKKTKAAPSPPTPAAPARSQLLDQIQGGVQLKPAKARELPPKPESPSTPREDLMSQIKAGIQLKPPKKRTPKAATTRPPTLLDTLKNSPKFQAMSEHMNSEAETPEEDDGDWD